MRLPLVCPQCGTILDVHESLDDPLSAPDPGDATICMHCGQLLVFTETPGVRFPRLQELEHYLKDPRVQAGYVALLNASSVSEAMGMVRRMLARRN